MKQAHSSYNKNQNNYIKSQKYTKINYTMTRTIYNLLQELFRLSLQDSELYQKRQELGQKILDNLCKTTKIMETSLLVEDVPQEYLLTNGEITHKLLGYYTSKIIIQNNLGNPLNPCIVIANKTPKKLIPISHNMFLLTLIHEWTHHYDYAKLHLIKSVHSKGFYGRMFSISQPMFDYIQTFLQ